MAYAPIALFVYNRPEHTRQTLEALKANSLASDSELFLFSDGPKSPEDCGCVDEVRRLLYELSGFKKVTTVERAENLGLAESIITGVTEVVSQYGNVIVLEDDMVTSPHFLNYMNDALDVYKDDDRVASIHGYVYPVEGDLSETFFLKGADCWGWATWARGWALFETDGRKLYSCLKQKALLKRFDFNNAYPYTKMLLDQFVGKNDSWAIRWYASTLLHDKLTLYPGRSLLVNIGTDESGAHCGNTQVYDTQTADEPVSVDKIEVEENAGALQAFEAYFRTIRPPWFHRILRMLQLK